MDGSQWIPYQPITFPTPPFPDYVSGHSTYSAAAAHILTKWTGSDRFAYSTTIAHGSSRIEPGITPVRAVTLSYPTFQSRCFERTAVRCSRKNLIDLHAKMGQNLQGFTAHSKNTEC
jgi:hypothetical protein